ncbi:2-phosphosulfolactate phosphatase [Vibrio mangrovi]|uniref:Probable 2-phosphosulfolactate phosphatase n=1 Tax=Vibrio mangrovi TaxID=474394 RepID=A0A1Y6IQB2_9VIBR|nr:2-phosphosulfolactate phosphatase [Vibrio mangrovi]MDW6003385.1 2-phosphosulfolactate phosphatase [Vibrio mangrovi]SMR99825.1 putative 2-phosphosulfolactate phosphatase [Vibrio mangrovi]
MKITTLNYVNDDAETLESCVVVIDQFRATSTIVSALANGVTEVVSCENFEAAEKIKLNLKNRNCYIAAEYQGKKHPNADFSNSPSYFINDHKITRLLLSTTNGTRVLNRCSGKVDTIYIASILNLSAVAEKLVAMSSNFTLYCSGNSGKFSIEDAYCAGGIILNLMKLETDIELSQSSKNVLDIFMNNTIDSLKHSPSAVKLRSIGAYKDVEFSLNLDSYSIVPELIRGGVIQVPIK